MCGRVYIKTTVSELLRSFGFAYVHLDLTKAGPRFNGAPGQDYPIIVREPERGGAQVIDARWGFIPSWSREELPKVQPINAKSETIRSSGMFRGAYRYSRGLMPINGFFEWRAQFGERVKQPFAIAMKDGSPFSLAVIWASRLRPEGYEERTFAVVTCEANAMMREVHDRMPVIIAEADRIRWLSETPDPVELMKPYPSELMTMWPINRKVGNVRNEGPDLLQPLTGDGSG